MPEKNCLKQQQDQKISYVDGKNVTKAFILVYLVFSALGNLVYTIFSNDFERFSATKLSVESALLVILALLIAPRISFDQKSGRELLASVLIVMFVGWNCIVTIIENRVVGNIVSFSACILAYALGVMSSKLRLSNSIVILWPIISSAILLVLIMYYLISGNIYYPQTDMVRPVLPGGLVSTELSNIVSINLIGLLNLEIGGQLQRVKKILFVLLFGILVWCLSVGSMLSFALILMVPHKIQDLKIKYLFGGLLFLTISIVLIYIMVEQGILDFNKFQDYTDGSFFNRLEQYSELAGIAMQNWYVGVGLGKHTDFPHHNILGLAAETGVISAFLYTSFCAIGLIGSMITAGETVGGPKCKSNGDALSRSLWFIAIFLFFKGFVHDTWLDRVFYFSLGYSITRK